VRFGDRDDVDVFQHLNTGAFGFTQQIADQGVFGDHDW